MGSKLCILLSYLFTTFLIFSCLAAVFPKMYQFYKERQIILENNVDLTTFWSNKPYLAKYRFYLFNITNVNEIRNSNASPVFKEIGPYMYNLNQQNYERFNNSDSIHYLNYDKLEFVSNESVSDENVSIFSFNVSLINSPCSTVNKTKHAKKDIIGEVTVKEILREIISFHASKYYISKINTEENMDEMTFPENVDYDLSHLENYRKMNYEIKNYSLCLKMLEIAPVFGTLFCKNGSSFMESDESFCDCMILTQKGKELEERKHPKRFKMLTKQFELQWNHASCSTGKNISSIPNEYGITDSSEFGLITKNNSQLLHNGDLRITASNYRSYFNAENTTEIITDFVSQFELNLEIQMIFENVTDAKVSTGVYPILRSEIDGKSSPETDSFLYYYVIYPRIFTNEILPRIIFLTVCFFAACSVITFILIRRGTEDIDYFEERTPLLKSKFQPHLSLIQNTK